jgi:hypothetical protein
MIVFMVFGVGTLLMGCGGEVSSDPNNICENPANTSMSATPECVYRSDPSVDFIVHNGKTYQKVDAGESLSGSAKKEGKEIGVIVSSWKANHSEELTATVLPKGTAVFKSGDDLVILAKGANKQLIAYKEVIEG